MPDRARRSPLPIVFLIVFLDLLGIGILIPIVPQLLANPDSAFYLLPAGWSVERGYLLLGLLVAVFPLMQFVATPILGELSDRFGRKPILIVSLMGTCASYVLFATGIIIRSLPLLFVARALDGFTGGNIAVAQAAISDTTPPEERAKNLGLIGAAFGLGFIMGPYLGGKLSDPEVVDWFDAATPFWFAALLSLANILFVAWRFTETLAALQPDRRVNWRRSAQNINHAWALAPLRPLYITNFLLVSGFTFFTTFFGVFLIDRFGFTQGDIGDFFSYTGLWIVFTQAVIVRRVAKRFKEPAVLRVSLIASGLCLLLYHVPTVSWGLLLVAPVFSIFNGLTQANLIGLLSRSASPRIQGEILGINASVQALAQVTPPMLAGVIASAVSPEAPLYVSSALIILAGLAFIALFVPVREPVA
jgi:DHA1 family tetracycline resistance protein-like MFS transporter